ncbi:MAG: hypothetical protein K6E40_15820 [Desulfovibrio sp.]|nr:hypothetical protein [Desulfovibrio sp.]
MDAPDLPERPEPLRLRGAPAQRHPADAGPAHPPRVLQGQPGDGGIAADGKDACFRLAGASERPRLCLLHQEEAVEGEASWCEAACLVAGNAGRVLSSESQDIADALRGSGGADLKTKCCVMHGTAHAVPNAGKDMRASGCGGSGLRCTEDNLHQWMQDYTAACRSGRVPAGSLPSKPAAGIYAAAQTINKATLVHHGRQQGRLRLNADTGEFVYAPADGVPIPYDAGFVADTFLLLAADASWAFDIKDAAFLVGQDADGNLHSGFGSAGFVDGRPSASCSSTLTAGTRSSVAMPAMPATTAAPRQRRPAWRRRLQRPCWAPTTGCSTRCAPRPSRTEAAGRASRTSGPPLLPPLAHVHGCIPERLQH